MKFSPDFAYRQLRRQLKKSKRSVAFFTSEDCKIVAHLLIGDVRTCFYNRTTGTIRLPNGCVIKFYQVNPQYPNQTICKLHGERFDFVWYHNLDNDELREQIKFHMSDKTLTYPIFIET